MTSHHVTGGDTPVLDCIIGQNIEERCQERSYLGPTRFEWPKTESRKPRYEKCIEVPKMGPKGENMSFSGLVFRTF